MRSAMLFAFCFVSFLSLSAQRLHVGLYGGAAAYSGDLIKKFFPGHKQTKDAVGFSLSYEISDHVMLRSGLTFAHIAGADSLSKDTALQHRNLSFQSGINEFSIVGEYYLFDLYETNFSPYVFAGIAFYHFNPYTYDQSGNKIFLQPLSTEGEGINGYSQPYSLSQIAIPFGGGLKFAINDNWRIGIEFGMRKLFTDYLDDVSTNYPDKNDLLNAKGQLAVQMSYRGDEVANGNPYYPAKGMQRGNPKSKDWYYFFGVHLTFRLNNGKANDGYIRNKKSGCRGS